MRLDQTIDTADFRASAILLVEDDESDILLLRRAFRNARIANPLVEVRDGQAAIQYLAGEGPYSDRARYPVPFLIPLALRPPKLAGFGGPPGVRAPPESLGGPQIEEHE